MQREFHKIPQTVIAFMGYCEVGALRGFDDGSEDLPGSGLIQHIEIPGGLEMLCHCHCFLSVIDLSQELVHFEWIEVDKNNATSEPVLHCCICTTAHAAV